MQMISVGTLEAKTHLSQLLALVRAGGVVEITRGRVPVALLIPTAPQERQQEKKEHDE